MKVSLLITTFNRFDALDLVLKTVAEQTRIPDKVIVCDDGSSHQTSMLTRRWSSKLPICHAWQPDNGFRAARSRNLGLSKSKTEYVVWIDGDCLLPPNFVENHLKLANPGHLVTGGRHLLSDSETQALLNGSASIQSAWKNWKFWSVALGTLRDLGPCAWETVRTCNLGIYWDELAAIDGFDESYVGWGREDSDVVVRLMNHGVKVRSGRLAACVAHLHHVERSRDQFSENDERFYNCLRNRTKIFPESSVFSVP